MTRLASLQWIVFVEIETAGIALLASIECRQLEWGARLDVSSRVDGNPEKEKRPLNGTNVLMTGDWWQFTSTGGVAVMSNPVPNQTNPIMSSFLVY